MRYEVSREEIKRAKHPHEVFLINLIFNHVFLFVAFISASSLQVFVLAVPVLSLLILTYTLWRARQSLHRDSWYVKCHWQLAARRSRLFIYMLALMGGVIGMVMLVSGGDPKPQHYAFGGVGILPTMIAVLALILMESDALHQAGNGLVPKWLEERYPNPEMRPIAE